MRSRFRDSIIFDLVASLSQSKVMLSSGMPDCRAKAANVSASRLALGILGMPLSWNSATPIARARVLLGARQLTLSLNEEISVW